MHATVKCGVIKTKPVNISHGGQMGCFKISVFTIQTVENLIFDVWTALQAPEQIVVRINEILNIKTRLKTSFLSKGCVQSLLPLSGLPDHGGVK